MRAGLSRWLREGPLGARMPIRLHGVLERATVRLGYGSHPAPLRWTLRPETPHAAILFGGDVALHRWPSGQAPAPAFGELAALSASADALIVNLETQLTGSATPAGTIGTSLKADPGAVEVLSYLGVRAVTCANNHCLDYGAAGLLDSARALQQSGITPTGILGEGRDGGALLDTKGIRVGLLAFTDDWRVEGEGAVGPVPHDPAQVRSRIAAMRAAADLVIVQLHWGYEWCMYPMLTQRNLARSYVEAGADLVLGHHAHVPMGVETWGRGAIAHGLGNLYFGHAPSGRHPFRNSSFLLRVEITRQGIGALEAIPVHSDAQGRVRVASGPESGSTRRALSYLSSRLGRDRYLGRVERSLTARQGCGVLIDLARRVTEGDLGAARERIAFLLPPRQRLLTAGLIERGGILRRIGVLLEDLRDRREDPASPSLASALAALASQAERFRAGCPQMGRIP